MSRNSANAPLYLGLVGAVLLALLIAGCGSSDVPGGSSTSTAGDDQGQAGEALDYARGETDLVLRVEQSGGFLPVEAVFTMVPGFSLYGDGRVIYPGPIPEIFPGPALPNLLQVQLSQDGVQQLLEAAREAGLTQSEPDLGQPPVADASTTVFTLTVNDRTSVVRAYALGYEDQFSPAGPSSDEASGGMSPGSSGQAGEGVDGSEAGGTETDSGAEAPPEGQGMPVFQLTDEQREARSRLLDFQGRLMDLGNWLGEELGPEEPYRFEAMDVISQQADPDTEDPSGLETNVQEWPLEDLAGLGEPEVLGRRFRVAGADLEALAPQLTQANMLTRWQSGGGLYLLHMRPLLPDEVLSPAPEAD